MYCILFNSEMKGEVDVCAKAFNEWINTSSVVIDSHKTEM
jgi:hypothetical protein